RAQNESRKPELEEKLSSMCARLPPPTRHYVDATEADLVARIQQERNYRELVRQKLQDHWFAALVAMEPGERFAIRDRFETWNELLDFIQLHEAIVEVFAS